MSKYAFSPINRFEELQMQIDSSDRSKEDTILASRKPYEAPRILSHELLEVTAGTCIVSGPGVCDPKSGPS